VRGREHDLAGFPRRDEEGDAECRRALRRARRVGLEHEHAVRDDGRRTQHVVDRAVAGVLEAGDDVDGRTGSRAECVRDDDAHSTHAAGNCAVEPSAVTRREVAGADEAVAQDRDGDHTTDGAVDGPDDA
jgi:hypothetical protein